MLRVGGGSRLTLRAVVLDAPAIVDRRSMPRSRSAALPRLDSTRLLGSKLAVLRGLRG